MLSGFNLGVFQGYMLLSSSPLNMEAACEFKTYMNLCACQRFKADSNHHIRVREIPSWVPGSNVSPRSDILNEIFFVYQSLQTNLGSVLNNPPLLNCILSLGDSAESEVHAPTFRNTLFRLPQSFQFVLILDALCVYTYFQNNAHR
jgi:hypothetical protein